MRLRLIAFLPPAALIAFLLLVSASSFVSAVEGSLIAEFEVASTPIRVQRYESECDVLAREIRALSRSMTSCTGELSCLGSPLLCAVTMDAEIERKYQGLRSVQNERCNVPPGLGATAGDGAAGAPSACGFSARGSRRLHRARRSPTTSSSSPRRSTFSAKEPDSNRARYSRSRRPGGGLDARPIMGRVRR